MANHLAIAAVTETLRKRIEQAVNIDLPGTEVVSRIPEAADGKAHSTVTVFLYRITPNAALRNADLPGRDSNGVRVSKPRAALDLHYLLSFSGDEEKMIPQRMLGRTVAAMHATPVLSDGEITTATAGHPILGASNLADDVESVKFGMPAMSLDDATKIWSVFLQVPYRLSATYDASVVLIESNIAVREPLPVQRRGVDAVLAAEPVIDRLNGGAPLVGGAALEITVEGRRLRGQRTFATVDGGDEHEIRTGTDTKVALPASLVSTLGAGVHALQVVHELTIGDPPAPHRGAASNVFVFVLRPRIAVAVGAADIAVTFAPPVGTAQRVHLLLNELLDPQADRSPLTFRLEPTFTGPGPWANAAFPVAGVPAGRYIVRANVDGAESLAGSSALVVTLP